METPGVDVFDKDFIDPHAFGQFKHLGDLGVVARIQDVDELKVRGFLPMFFKACQETEISQNSFKVACGSGRLQEAVLFFRHGGQVDVQDIKKSDAFDPVMGERCIGEEMYLEFIPGRTLDDLMEPAVEGRFSPAGNTDFPDSKGAAVIEYLPDLFKFQFAAKLLFFAEGGMIPAMKTLQIADIGDIQQDDLWPRQHPVFVDGEQPEMVVVNIQGILQRIDR